MLGKNKCKSYCNYIYLFLVSSSTTLILFYFIYFFSFSLLTHPIQCIPRHQITSTGTYPSTSPRKRTSHMALRHRNESPKLTGESVS